MWKNEIKLCEAPVFGENRKGSNTRYGMKEPNLIESTLNCPLQPFQLFLFQLLVWEE